MNQALTEPYDFASLNLQVGGRIQFLSHRAIKPLEHFSTLIGYLKDEYLIVKIPAESNAFGVAQEGDKLTIRIFSGVSVCWFSCTIMRIFSRSLNYMHLSFPTTIEGRRLRKTMRVKVDLAARISAPELGLEPAAVYVRNLSTSGVLIESPTLLPTDLRAVNLSFALNQAGATPSLDINTCAVIVNSTVDNPTQDSSPNDKTEVFTYGLQFIDLDPMQQVMLQNLTYEAFIDDRTRIV
jgi:c-di-GMP-binding flagellar brake protein YcgR